MGEGRKVERYKAEGHYSVRPIGASWKGRDDAPHSSSRRKIVVLDQAKEGPQDLLPEEAELLHGFAPGTTAGDGISAIMRLRCLGGGYDMNVVRLILRPRNSVPMQYLIEQQINTLKTGCDDRTLLEAETLYAISRPR